MGISLAFRAGFYCVALLAVFYTRTLVFSSAVLALSAWLFYGHPEGNSAGQEFIVFLWTWAAAVATAWLISPPSATPWIVQLEWSLLNADLRHRLRSADAITWAMSLVLGILAYTATELVGYDRGTFYRLQSLVWLLLLMLVVCVFDTVSGRKGYHLLPDAVSPQFRHQLVVCVIGLAVFVDTLARDATIYRWLLPALGFVLVMAAFRWWLRDATTARRRRSDKRD